MDNLTPELNKAVALFKTDLPKILEDKKVKIPTKSGREINFTYATLDQILEQVTPVLSQHGLILSSFTGFVGDRFALITTLRHISGEQIQSIFPLPLDFGIDPKELGIKIAYGRRYNVNCLLELHFADSENRDEVVMKLASDFKKEVGFIPPPTQTQTVNQPVRPQPVSTPNTDRNLIMLEIESVLKRKNFSIQLAADMLSEKYGVRSRSQLSDEQLIQFLEIIRLQPSHEQPKTA